MAVELLSIVVFTFAVGLLVLGAITWWLERGLRRNFGLAMMAAALLIAALYAFLGSRFSILFFGRLIVAVDLPRLMFTALTYTFGVLLGLGMAAAVFLWASRRFVKPTVAERQMAAVIVVIILLGLLLSWIAVLMSR